ncbi:MAG: UxaA family hydrolase [Peptostreptococcus porci]|nr:UxaA family hydrolase [Peptostreptococcus porci]
MEKHKFLIHANGDDVGVAIEDIQKGEKVIGVDLATKNQVVIEALNDIPLGHKIALKNKKIGEDLIKYGEVVGEVTENFYVGDWVHTHNMRTKRWNYGA